MAARTMDLAAASTSMARVAASKVNLAAASTSMVAAGVVERVALNAAKKVEAVSALAAAVVLAE